jgi:hypothetical protein
MTNLHLQGAAAPRKSPSTDKTADETLTTLLARGSLSEARRWFQHMGWFVLPQSDRGRRILRWGAGQAWLASPANPERGVRRWCRRWAPWLKPAELDQLVVDTATSNKQWTPDQSAAVLWIGVRDHEYHGFRFLGANDDPNYEYRNAARLEKAAARARKFRAAHSTGAKRGRPSLQLSEEDMLARRRAQGAERKRAERARKKAAMGGAVTIKSVRDIKSLITNYSSSCEPIGAVTDLSVTEFHCHAPQPPDHESRARPASRRAAPLSGDIIIESDGTVWFRVDDDPEPAPYAVATGAPNQSRTERRAP